MTRKCIYCKSQLDEDSVIDVCKKCGFQVWGKNMFNAITQNMENARQTGDLYQGSVTSTPRQPAKNKFFPLEIKPVHKNSETVTEQNILPEETPLPKPAKLFSDAPDEF